MNTQDVIGAVGGVIGSVVPGAGAAGSAMSRAAQMLTQTDALIGGKDAGQAGAPARGPGSFADTLVDAIQGVQQAQSDATAMQKAYQQGDSDVGLETTMIAMNKASLSFQMLAQARNKVVAAYNEVMNMQV